MATSAQTLANQANSLHSTGPRTEQGKLRSSQNSFKHGLTGATVVLPTEDMAAYQEFSRRFLADYEPEGAMKNSLPKPPLMPSGVSIASPLWKPTFSLWRNLNLSLNTSPLWKILKLAPRSSKRMG